MLVTMGFTPPAKELEPLRIELKTVTNEMVALIGAATMIISCSRLKTLDSDVGRCKTKSEVHMLAVQALRKMLEVARVADTGDETRVRESKIKINSPEEMNLDDRLEPHKMDTQPTKTETENRSQMIGWNNIRWTYILRRQGQENWN